MNTEKRAAVKKDEIIKSSVTQFVEYNEDNWVLIQDVCKDGYISKVECDQCMIIDIEHKGEVFINNGGYTSEYKKRRRERTVLWIRKNIWKIATIITATIATIIGWFQEEIKGLIITLLNQ